jgi:hypothetical protein
MREEDDVREEDNEERCPLHCEEHLGAIVPGCFLLGASAAPVPINPFFLVTSATYLQQVKHCYKSNNEER